MKPALLAVVMSVTALGLVLAQGQGKDFSGKWVVDVEKTAAAAPAAEQRHPTTEMQITMDAKTMTIVSKGPAGTRETVYKLDGSPSAAGATVSATGGRAGAPVESTAKWDSDGTLMITTKLYNGNSVMKYKLEGTDLKVEYQGPGLPKPRVAIYKKVS